MERGQRFSGPCLELWWCDSFDGAGCDYVEKWLSPHFGDGRPGFIEVFECYCGATVTWADLTGEPDEGAF